MVIWRWRITVISPTQGKSDAALSNEAPLFQSTADSELILHLIAQSTRRKQIDKIIDAVSQLEGAFSLAILTDDALIA